MTIAPYIRKVQYYENDPMGIVHHSNYLRWFEETRVDFMDQIGFGYHKVTMSGIDFPLLGSSCEYRSMVSFGDTVAIQPAISRFDKLRMNLTYSVVDLVSGQLRATGETGHCFYSTNKKRPVSLEKELPDLYEIFLRIYYSQKG